jgi:hypothetical protein
MSAARDSKTHMTTEQHRQQAIYYQEQRYELEAQREQPIDKLDDLKVENFLNGGESRDALSAAYAAVQDNRFAIEDAFARFDAAVEAEQLEAVRLKGIALGEKWKSTGRLKDMFGLPPLATRQRTSCAALNARL